jgi:hypothetical protein
MNMATGAKAMRSASPQTAAEIPSEAKDATNPLFQNTLPITALSPILCEDTTPQPHDFKRPGGGGYTHPTNDLITQK